MKEFPQLTLFVNEVVFLQETHLLEPIQGRLKNLLQTGIYERNHFVLVHLFQTIVEFLDESLFHKSNVFACNLVYTY